MADNPVTTAGETVGEVAETAKDVVNDIVEQATETAEGATQIPADVLARVPIISDALDALTDRVVALERTAGDTAQEATAAAHEVVEEVVEPEAVPNNANRSHRAGWLDAIR